ncbi:ProQ [Legionella beliardensis]|uniref:ProQ n=1 Tax=Legionella beliardensis TaxID=91822 RepID=A0A378HXX4_9GAMM|nr:ProQ/FinO family protein [Legionella beliardensis]STX27662.1 ProQ [Legionella beliardensis]
MRRHELHPRTAAINKAQKNQSKKAKSEALSWLATTFPQAFDNTVRIRPLKAGIMDDILQHADKASKLGISRSKIREAVVLFTRRLDYLICLKTKEMRVDLEGNPVEPVTDEEALRAAIKIKKRIEKSVRNTRKPTDIKPSTQGIRQVNKLHHQFTHAPTSNDNQPDLHYIERPPLFNTANSLNTSVKPTVIVKQKTTRQYDPSAIARLKEKLGLARKTEKET